MLKLSFLITVDIILLTMILINFNLLLNFLEKIINCCRDFIKRNDGFFSIFFIILFSLEQAILIILIYVFSQNLSILKFIVSIFSLVVITTASLQKFLLETKRRYEKEQTEVAKKAEEFIIKVLNRLKEKNPP